MSAAVHPDPSIIEVGNLYADVQSRALWLGVDPSVNPNESILIADIVGLLEADAAVQDAATAYTDAQVALRAPVSHTHTASQITDFTAAVTDVATSIPQLNWVRGMIMLWSGSVAQIGVGSLAGWSLCDGGNGTPDLRDRFVIGAGNKLPGDKNPLTEVKTDVQGAHVHTIGGTVLSAANLPSHAHAVSISGRVYGATYGGAGAHTHQHNMNVGSAGSGSGLRVSDASAGEAPSSRSASMAAGSHDHACFVDLSGAFPTDSRGSSTSHTHSESTAGSHEHTFTSNQIRDVLPFYALAYIMKL